MEVWKYIEILGQKQLGWLFKKDNTEARLISLFKILEFGYPSTIHNLIPFLRDKNTEVQHATCDVIIQLFKKIKSKKGYYESLKYCDISESDIEYYKATFSNDQYIILLSIASLNGNGYLREFAVKKLSETMNEKAIPFIVYRLADWVEPIRSTAFDGLSNFKKKEFINVLVDNLTLFKWLQKVQRVDLGAVYSDIIKYVVIDNRQYVRERFSEFTDRARFLIAKEISSSESIALADVNLLLNDSHFMVRCLALNHFDKLTPAESAKLLTDKSARVRFQTLFQLQDRNDFPEFIVPFLSDNSGTIREFARHCLKDKSLDFAPLYNDNLLNRKKIIGSLNGLAETNGKQFISSIESFLTDKTLKVRKASFLALKKLDEDIAYSFALQNLDSTYIGIRNMCIEFLSISATQEVLKKARDIYATGNLELKKSMLKLFSKIGKWATIADIMIGTIDDNEEIRKISIASIEQWLKKSASYYFEPKPGEKERAIQIFNFAFEMHEEKKYFYENPLNGLDFYFK